MDYVLISRSDEMKPYIQAATCLGPRENHKAISHQKVMNTRTRQGPYGEGRVCETLNRIEIVLHLITPTLMVVHKQP